MQGTSPAQASGCQYPPHLLGQHLILLLVQVICSRRGIACSLLALLELEQAALHSLMLCLHTHIPPPLQYPVCMALL